MPKEVTLYEMVDEYHGPEKDFSWHRYIKNGIRYKDYPNKYHEVRTLGMHRFIVTTMLNMMIRDIIEQNVQIDFEYKKKVFLSLRMADRDPESYLYQYRIKDRGHDFIPYCITSKHLWRSTHRYFLWTLGKHWDRLMRKTVKNGMVYEPAPKVKYKKKRQYALQLRVYNTQGRNVPDSEKTLES